MKEIGGYLGLEEFQGREYHANLIGVNSGRNALLYILKVRGYHKLYLPRFLCDSVSALCRREGYEYEEYGIDEAFLPVFDRTLQPDEALYIVNFYGQVSDAYVLEMKARFGNIIFDNVHSFFRHPLPDVDTVYSCRKFFGVPDGGYVSCQGGTVPDLEIDTSYDRMTHILGRFEVSASAYYQDFQKNDDVFYSLPLRRMSALTQNILRGVDYASVRQKRNENYLRLHTFLGDKNRLTPVPDDGPYAYPFYCKGGMALKKKLAGQKIYVATLWPNVLDLPVSLERDYAENILPLPCDQRYGPEDMAHMIEALQTFLNEMQ